MNEYELTTAGMSVLAIVGTLSGVVVGWWLTYSQYRDAGIKRRKDQP